MPNAEFVQAWIAALESGEFKQTTSALATNKGHCCLGVACEVAIRDGFVPELQKRVCQTDRHGEPTEYAYGSDGDFRNAILPPAVKLALGLSSAGGSYGHGSAQLTADNDNGVPFERIAAIIRKRPVGLFVDESNS